MFIDENEIKNNNFDFLFFFTFIQYKARDNHSFKVMEMLSIIIINTKECF